MTVLFDASVVLKWFFSQEKEAQKARDWRLKHESGKVSAAILDLTFYELVNVLSAKPEVKSGEAKKFLNLLAEFQFQIIGIGQEISLMHEVFIIARKYAISVYDAAYLWQAKRINCKLITADEKLYERTKESGVIRLL